MKNWNRHNAISKFVRSSRKDSKMTQLELSDLTGVGLRFVRDLEQGKPNLMTDKVNQVLLFFGMGVLSAQTRSYGSKQQVLGY